MADQTSVALPSAPIRPLAPNATLQPPLSRRGHGPGLVVIDPGHVLPAKPSAEPPSETLDPPPQYKWAEEGYAVVRISVGGSLCEAQAESWGVRDLGRALEALVGLEECDVKDKFALMGEFHLFPLIFFNMRGHDTGWGLRSSLRNTL